MKDLFVNLILMGNLIRLHDNAARIAFGACLGLIAGIFLGFENGRLSERNHAELQLTAFRQYYINVETLLDSLEYNHGLNMMDTDMETDYGCDYLEAKAKVDTLCWRAQ